MGYVYVYSPVNGTVNGCPATSPCYCAGLNGPGAFCDYPPCSHEGYHGTSGYG